MLFQLIMTIVISLLVLWILYVSEKLGKIDFWIKNEHEEKHKNDKRIEREAFDYFILDGSQDKKRLHKTVGSHKLFSTLCLSCGGQVEWKIISGLVRSWNGRCVICDKLHLAEENILISVYCEE